MLTRAYGKRMSYGKIFESLFTGSMVGSGPVVFSVWAYVIANAHPPGIVELHPRLLAVVIGCSQREIEDAVTFLSSPDPNSRSQEHEGRRLLHEGRFCYTVVNFDRYREMRNEETRRIQNREAQRRWRERKQPSAESAKAEAEAQARSEMNGGLTDGSSVVVRKGAGDARSTAGEQSVDQVLDGMGLGGGA